MNETSYLGMLPNTWNTIKIEEVYKERNTKASAYKFRPLSVTKKGVLPQLDYVAKTNDFENRKLVKINDFVINSRSDRRGSCGISKFEGSVSLINTVLNPLNVAQMNQEYYGFLFETNQFAEEFYRWGRGIVDDLWSTKWQEMKKIGLPYPTLFEQKQIADYLDQKCGEIDDILSGLNKELDLLNEYKKSLIMESVTKGFNTSDFVESEIPWIGKIPKHWRMIPNKYLFVESTEKVGSNWDRYQLLSLTTSGVKEKDINDIGGKMPTSYNNYLVVKKNQMVFCLFDLDVSAVFSGLSNYDGMITSAYNVYDTTDLLDARYANYYFANVFSNRSYKVYSKNLRYTVSSDDFNNIKTLVPPIEEQVQIADYLDKKCREIDDISSDIRKEIEILKEYKKSTIYEYVTGKKGVEHE